MSKTDGQIAYEAAIAHDPGEVDLSWDHPCMEDFRGAWEASGAAVRDKARRETIEECARRLETQASHFVETAPGTTKDDWIFAEVMQGNANLIRSLASAPRQGEEPQRGDTSSPLAKSLA